MKLTSLFGRSSPEADDVAPDYFDVGGTVYAVGDIHGEIELLDLLVARIRRDVERTDPYIKKTLVFLGDYVDRGPRSRDVLDFLMELDIPGCALVFIRGNHDKEMLSFARDPIGHRRWLGWGGSDTMKSFGLPAIFPTASDDELLAAGKEFAAALGEDRKRWIEEDTKIWIEIGNLILSHAGMDPDVPVDEQKENMMLWGSPRFIAEGGPPDYWHVHGHYVHAQAAVIGNRIAVDTGAYQSGILSVARITDDGCAFLQQT
jgi:serine/threonine protein phosphatase 1